MFVLATAYERHALEAFELGVVDYLLKPFSEERVVQCLRRLQQRGRAAPPAAGGPPRIVARRKRSLVFLEPQEIWAFEAADRLTFVHTLHGTFDIDLSLAAVEASFGRAFVRVHRNWLVNAAHIKELERDGHETKLFVGAGVADAGKGVRVPGRARAGGGGARDAAHERDGPAEAREDRRAARRDAPPGRRAPDPRRPPAQAPGGVRGGLAGGRGVGGRAVADGTALGGEGGTGGAAHAVGSAARMAG